MSTRFIIWGLVSVVFFTIGLVGLAFSVGDLVASLQGDLHPKVSILVTLFVSAVVFLAAAASVLALVISILLRILRLQRERAKSPIPPVTG